MTKQEQNRNTQNPNEIKWDRDTIDYDDPETEPVVVTSLILIRYFMETDQEFRPDKSVLAAIATCFKENPELRDLWVKISNVVYEYWAQELDLPVYIQKFLQKFRSRIIEMAG